tara:strand:- start:1656 stop:1829 length:174 start_codon:yes stop_codon:yes gene_type:complete
MKLTVNKGLAKKNGMFIWSIWLVFSPTKKLPAGTVLARTATVAKKKAKAKVKKNFRL